MIFLFSFSLHFHFLAQFLVYGCCSVVKLCPTLCQPMDCNTPGFPVIYYLRVSTNSCPLSQLCYSITISSSGAPFFSCLQSFPTSVFSNELAFRIRQPKYWSFSTSPRNEYSGLISFRIDWFDLLAVQGTFQSVLQHHNLKASFTQVLSLLYSPALTSVHDYWQLRQESICP